MILGTLRDGTRDGTLVVVHQDRTRALKATDIAPTLQKALDQWSECAPKLRKLSEKLHASNCPGSFSVSENSFHAPLPRAYAWMDGSAFLHHVKLVRQARGAEMPESFLTDPLMYQGGSDSFLAPTEDIRMVTEDWGIDFESEVVVVTDDVPMGVTPQAAEKHIQLFMICNDVSLRNLIPDELAKGFGFLQSKPSSSFAPFALTPDELGDAWKDGRVHLPLTTHLNGKLFGCPEAGAMHFSFGQLIAHAAKTRPLCAGTVIGSGTVSNEDPTKGSSCLVEKRMLEKIQTGKSVTPFMKFGDSVTIEMKKNNVSLFGRIYQKVTKA